MKGTYLWNVGMACSLYNQLPATLNLYNGCAFQAKLERVVWSPIFIHYWPLPICKLEWACLWDSLCIYCTTLHRKRFLLPKKVLNRPLPILRVYLTREMAHVIKTCSQLFTCENISNKLGHYTNIWSIHFIMKKN